MPAFHSKGSKMISVKRSTPVLVLGMLAASAACVGPGDARTSGDGTPESTGRVSAPLAVVTNGAITNLYVYPDPSKGSWDDYLKTLPPSLFCAGCTAATFSSETIDAVTDRIMKPQFPSYFDALGQYHVSAPLFFGSAAVSQACWDAAKADMNNGVLEATTIRSLANCHVDGMDPSPQINLIFSPDLAIGIPPSWPTGAANSTGICSTPSLNTAAWHWWGLNVPNFTAVPTNQGCAGSFNVFTNNLTHEIVEMLSDPGQTGVGGAGGTEIGDHCEAPNFAEDRTAFLDNPSLDVARYWSDVDGNCQPRLDSPSGSTSLVWQLGGASAPTDRVPTVTVPVPQVRTTTNAAATQVSIVFKESTVTTSVDVALTFAGGTSAPTVVSVAPGAASSATLTLPSGVRVSDITGVQLSNINSVPLQAWAADAIALVVSFSIGSELTIPPGPIVDTWLDDSALPLIRMTGDVHDITLPLPTPNPDAGYPVQALDLVVSTGNDDLRGGSNAGDNCDATITLGAGQTITVPNINAGQAWAGWSIHSVSIPVPAAGLHGGDISSVSLHTGFGGGISGDNWNVERVQLLATLVPPPPVVGQLAPLSGLPAGGETITIHGANFDTTGQTQFFFDGVPATNVVCTSRTQCTVTNPPGSGASHVTATGQGGSSTNFSEFDYAPSVTGMSKTTTFPGDTITVYGIGLFQGQTTLTFGPYPVQSATCTIDQCSVLVPGGAGTVDIRAFVNGVETTAVAADKFTYPVPAVTGIDVASGPVSGYTTFNLEGTGFPGALWASTYSPPTIYFGGVAALDVFCPYNNWCTGWTPPVPASMAGPVQVTVEQFGVSSTGNVTFDYLLSQDIQSFSVTQTGGTIQFLQPIPAGGAAVSVSCSDPSMMPTQQVLVSAGATSASVPFPAWIKNETVTLTASYGGYSVSASLDAVVPPPPSTDAGAPANCPKGWIDCGDGTCAKRASLCQ